MAFEQRSLDDYIDVAQRIADFRERYPQGCLQPLSSDNSHGFRIVQVEGHDKNDQIIMQTFVVVVAAAYRTPDDPRPGIGMAWEVFPGRTPYTRGSELQNAETSAWGRAIIAVGASDAKRGIASREEVRNRQAEREDGLPVNRDGSTSRSRVTDAQLEQAGQMTKAQLSEHNKLERDVLGTGPQGTERLSATPADDPWQVNPPVADSRPKPAGWLLSERFAKLGIFDRKERLEQCSEIVGRPVGSSNELEPGEVAAVLEALQKRELAQ